MRGTGLAESRTGQVVQDFLGSAQIFTSAVNDMLEEELRAIAGNQLTFSQLKLLKMVSVTGGYMVTDVANFLGVSNAAASRAVDRMVRRGLLDRTEAESDRRAVHISLTPAGRELVNRYDEATDRVLANLFGEVSPEHLLGAAVLMDNLSVSIVSRDHDPDEVCFRCGVHFRDRCLLRQLTNRNCHFHTHHAEEGKGARSDDGNGDGRLARRRK